MEQLVELLSGNPLALAVAVIVAVMILLSFFRKVVQLLIVVVEVAVLYAAYLQISGGDAPETFRQMQETVSLSLGRLGATLKPLFELLKSWK